MELGLRSLILLRKQDPILCGDPIVLWVDEASRYASLQY